MNARYLAQKNRKLVCRVLQTLTLVAALVVALPLVCSAQTQAPQASGLTFSGHVYVGQPPSTSQSAAAVQVELYGSPFPWSEDDPGVLLASTVTSADGVFELSSSPDVRTYPYYHVVRLSPPGLISTGAQAGPYGSVTNADVVTYIRPVRGAYTGIGYWQAPLLTQPVETGPGAFQQAQQQSSQSSQESSTQSSEGMEGIPVDRGTPSKGPVLPDTLLIGAFVLHVERYDDSALRSVGTGRGLEVAPTLRPDWEDLSGTAWMELPCALPELRPLLPELPGDRILIDRVYQVVPAVRDPQTEISLVDAQRFKARIAPGDELTLSLQARDPSAASLLQAKEDLIQGIVGPMPLPALGIRVRFRAPSVVAVLGRARVGRIVEGSAVYPTEPRYPKELRATVDGFSATIEEIALTPDGSTARITLLLPKSIAAVDTCDPAQLVLEDVAITPDCEFYRDYPADPFGPWIIGDTGLIVSGTGVVVDFSSDRSPSGRPLSWKGIFLRQGTASGDSTIPEPSNTGYLRGRYTFLGARITSSGLQADLSLSEPHVFEPLQPSGYTITVQAAVLHISESRIIGGTLGPGRIQCPKEALTRDGVPNVAVFAYFSTLAVQDDLDIAGEAAFDAGGFKARVGWGELTHPGEEIVAWNLGLTHAYVYFSAAPNPSFTPDTGSGFLDLSLPIADPDQVVLKLEARGMSGVTVGKGMSDIEIHSPDRPGGRSNPIKMTDVYGWLRIGTQGLDGALRVMGWNTPAFIGNVARFGYVGGVPFDARLVLPGQKERPLLLQFADSAVYDSEINGEVNIPEPCNIPKLAFSDMEVTSTAHLVGGAVELPVAGVTLQYWDLGFEPTGDPTQAGVVSARTGRLIFTAAGISESIHFAQAFKLTWCEMLANGNLGELFLDFNDYGQRFDGFPFSPHKLDLSDPEPGKTGLEARAYLAVCGDVRFPQFGAAYVNVKDARHPDVIEPYYNRYVTVPKTGEPGCAPTDLTLAGTWDDSLSRELLSLLFPDLTMDYNETAQLGFIGTGQADLSFLHSDGLEATIDIHPDPILGRPVIDIRFVSDTAHDLDVGLYARLASIGQIAGCIRIDGPLLQRIAVGGYLEQSAATGFAILAPKMAYMVEVSMSVTPSSLQFYAGGDLLVQVAGSAVDVYGSVFLAVDYARASTEGEIIGRIDCNTVIAGMEGEGQLTWYLDPDEQVLQGKISIGLCSWVGGIDLEGGLFLGHNADRDRAWVLYAGSGHFGIPEGFLEERITGIYGYGKLAAGIQYYVFGGGYELYIGMGALFPTLDAPLPTFLGSGGLYVHGEILGGLVSASAWATLSLRAPAPFYFEGEFGLEGCVLWVICASVEVTGGFDSGGFYIY
jgi:hypothetical protein